MIRSAVRWLRIGSYDSVYVQCTSLDGTKESRKNGEVGMYRKQRMDDGVLASIRSHKIHKYWYVGQE